MGILATLTSRKKEQQAGLWQRYVELLKAEMAGGHTVDAAEASTLLTALGKTPDDIATDTELLRKRQVEAGAMEAGATAQRDAKTAERELETLFAQRDAFFREWNPRHVSATTRLESARAAVTRAGYARGMLVRTCADPSIATGEADIMARRGELVQDPDPAETARLDARWSELQEQKLIP